MANLPMFQISEIATDHCLGRLDRYSLLNEKWAFCLLVRNQVIWGRFLNITESQTRAEFWPENPAHLRELTVGAMVPFLDDYLGERTEAVLDAGRTWDRALFEARDAVQYSTGLMTIAGPNAPAGGVIVPGGWNHTHCFVCHATISEVHPVFYQSSEGERVCEACYTNYIVLARSHSCTRSWGDNLIHHLHATRQCLAPLHLTRRSDRRHNRVSRRS